MSESTMGQVKGSDLISRQKVLNIIDWVHYHYCFSPSEERIFDYLKGVIAECEASTTAPVKHGKWIVNHRVLKLGMPFLSEEVTIIKCSECGATTTGKYNYCPNCGATMDKGEVE